MGPLCCSAADHPWSVQTEREPNINRMIIDIQMNKNIGEQKANANMGHGARLLGIVGIVALVHTAWTPVPDAYLRDRPTYGILGVDRGRLRRPQPMNKQTPEVKAARERAAQIRQAANAALRCTPDEMRQLAALVLSRQGGAR